MTSSNGDDHTQISGSNGEPNGGSAPDLRILGDEVLLQPSGVSEPSKARKTTSHPKKHTSRSESEEQLLGHIARFRSNPFSFLREISLFITGTGWRGYENVIGPPIFHQGFSDNMKSNVLEHPMLQQCMHEMAEKWTDHIQRQGWFAPPERNPDHERDRKRWMDRNLGCYHDMVEIYLDKMICKMESKRFIRSAYYLTSQLLLRAYHQGIHISSEEILKMRKIAAECAAKKQSIVFLPCHKSHVDYVSLQLIFYRLGIALPTVVAGDNLNFPVVGSFLQHAGAMWIKRKFDPDDRLYHATVQAYIDTLLTGGYNLECFIEGGRSRTGKLLPPKFGILGFVLDSILSRRVRDAVICPVSTQYDKVIETEGYVTELLGVPKRKENLLDFVAGGSSVLSLRLGRVDVRFHDPWSLRDFIDGQLARMAALPRQPNFNIDDPTDKQVRMRLLRTLGYRVLSEINEVSVIMPTALIGTILLTSGGRGIGCTDLGERVQWLVDRIRAKGGRVAHFGESPLEEVILRGLEVLGKGLVGEEPGIIEPTFFPVDRFQLSFYRNMTIHLFIAEALVCVSLYPRTKKIVGFDAPSMSYEELHHQVSFLSTLFRAEFIFPSEGLEANLKDTLLGLEEDGVLQLRRSEEGEKIESVWLSEKEKEAEWENYDFYCFLLWPFTDAVWLAAISLMGLTPPMGISSDTWIDVSKAQNVAQEVCPVFPTFSYLSPCHLHGCEKSINQPDSTLPIFILHHILQLGKMLYQQGSISYIEAVNKETLKNSYQRFQEEGMIEVTHPNGNGNGGGNVKGHNTNTSNTPLRLRLSPEWHVPRDPVTGELQSEGRLWDFISKIHLSRRERKHRRDFASVRARNVWQVDEAGRLLFEEALATQKSTKLGENERVQGTPKHRRKIGEQQAKL